MFSLSSSSILPLFAFVLVFVCVLIFRFPFLASACRRHLFALHDRLPPSFS
jgi:hypothetical protein